MRGMRHRRIDREVRYERENRVVLFMNIPIRLGTCAKFKCDTNEPILTQYKGYQLFRVLSIHSYLLQLNLVSLRKRIVVVF